MIVETLKKYNLKQLDFLEFSNISKTKLFYALKKQDPIYIDGLKKKFGEYLDWKAKQLQKATDQYHSKSH